MKDRSDLCRGPVVVVSGGGAPAKVSRVRLCEVPEGVGFAVVVGAAGRAEVPVGGGPVGIADGVVDVAGCGRAGAGDAAAGLVAHHHVVDEVLGWPVAGGAVVEEPPAGWVGEQPPPGALGGDAAGDRGGQWPVAGQVAWVLVDPDQGVSDLLCKAVSAELRRCR
jgi:hypothetical protein